MGECKMTLTKTLQQLLERAEKNGVAVKRVREGAVMGNTYGNREWVKTTPMIEQWRVACLRTGGEKEYIKFTVWHYGTIIADFGKKHGESWVLNSWYGQSNTDRDTLNALTYHFGISGYSFSYRKGVFSNDMVNTRGTR
jgi:hypothetical protein